VTDTIETRPPVLVVGAGPTGLLLAAELQRRGVPVHLKPLSPLGPVLASAIRWDTSNRRLRNS
jgi:hypothetical protein